MRVLLPVICLLAILLSACSSTPVNAPVGSRGTEPETAAKTASRTRPTAAPASKPRVPVGTPIPAARATGGIYVVRRGDTLYSIAWQQGLNVKQLAGMNGIRSPYTIYTGQRLRVRPGTKSPPAVRTHTPVSRPKPVPPAARKTAPDRPVAADKPAPKLPAVVKYWVWPVKGPVISGYHPNSPGKKGIDIGGKKGQSVKAAAAGKVVYSGSGLVGYGRLIIIKHNETLLSAYGHNSKLLVSEGEYVKAGQVIANMGSSGTDRTRLYFEIRKNGKPVNPLRYLPRG